MSTAADIQATVQELVTMSRRAREFKWQCGPRIYTLRTPTDHEMRVMFLRYSTDGAQMLLMQRAVVEQAIVGWSGVTAQDLLPDQPPADVPFDKALVPLLLDQKEGDFKQLVEALFDRYDKRSKSLEEDAKNS